ncbi:MAG TPA: hypothetical protein P5307_05090 [Pirellulaceae bacterium]|nr:hypothetical protein [Pirellulaceae bacterium]
MTRKFVFALTLGAATAIATFAVGQEPASPFRTTELSQNDVSIVQVRDRGRRYRGNYYGNRRYNNNYYSPYQYDYRNYNYGYRPYGSYYGTRNYGYYNYGRRGGGVRIGPFGVWW